MHTGSAPQQPQARRRASWCRISSVARQNGSTVGTSTCSSGECAPLQAHTGVCRQAEGVSSSNSHLRRHKQQRSAALPLCPCWRRRLVAVGAAVCSHGGCAGAACPPVPWRAHSRDGGAVADGLQPRQLLADDAALQARVDRLDLGCLACTTGGRRVPGQAAGGRQASRRQQPQCQQQQRQRQRQKLNPTASSCCRTRDAANGLGGELDDGGVGVGRPARVRLVLRGRRQGVRMCTLLLGGAACTSTSSAAPAKPAVSAAAHTRRTCSTSAPHSRPMREMLDRTCGRPRRQRQQPQPRQAGAQTGRQRASAGTQLLPPWPPTHLLKWLHHAAAGRALHRIHGLAASARRLRLDGGQVGGGLDQACRAAAGRGGQSHAAARGPHLRRAAA